MILNMRMKIMHFSRHFSATLNQINPNRTTNGAKNTKRSELSQRFSGETGDAGRVDRRTPGAGRASSEPQSSPGEFQNSEAVH